MKLNRRNYHQEKEHLSSSFVKNFIKCEAGAIEEWENGSADKECFKEGQLFETLVAGTKREREKFFLENPEMISTQGKNKGQLKSNYKATIVAAEKIRCNKFLMKVVRGSKKQKIFTGTIDGLPFKVMLDLLYKDGSIYDLKYMKDFKDSFNEKHGCYEPWYQACNYHVQLYIYREILRQNGIDVKHVGLIAASKEKADGEPCPDIAAITFSEDWMDLAKSEVYNATARIKQIWKENSKPIRCERCSNCVKTRIVTEFEEV